MLTGNDLDNLRNSQYDTDNTWPEPESFQNPVRQVNSKRKQPTLPPIPPVGGGGDRGKEMGSEACDLVVANLSAFQDGELDPDQQRVIEAHLHKCDYCASVFAAIKTTDMALEREWREGAPLPSSLEVKVAIDSIMEALPPVPAPAPQFEPKRVHARTRWMRFATGMTGGFALVGMLMSSYAIGFANGRKSRQIQPVGLRFSSALPMFASSSPSSSNFDSPPLLRLPNSLSQTTNRQTVRR
jgi:hypothetical protein